MSLPSALTVVKKVIFFTEENLISINSTSDNGSGALMAWGSLRGLTANRSICASSTQVGGDWDPATPADLSGADLIQALGLSRRVVCGTDEGTSASAGDNTDHMAPMGRLLPSVSRAVALQPVERGPTTARVWATASFWETWAVVV